jgi:hypothetical protein
MKLTEDRLKAIILEEVAKIEEQEPEKEKAADPVKSLTQLKQDLLDTSKNIQNVKGLDPTEIQSISAVLGAVLQVASAGSAAAILQRVHDVLQKQIK